MDNYDVEQTIDKLVEEYNSIIELIGEFNNKINDLEERIIFLKNIENRISDLFINFEKLKLKDGNIENELYDINKEINTIKLDIDKIEIELLYKINSIKPIPGKDGYTPIKGKDYFDGKDGHTPIKGKDYFDGKDADEDKIIKTIVKKIPRPKDGITPIKGKDYFDGKDADEDKIIREVVGKIPIPKDGSPDTGKEIVDKINKLPKKSEFQIDATHIKNLPITKVLRGSNNGGASNLISYIRSQYSSRFSENISVTTIEEALDAIFDFSYVAPAITLVGNPTTSIRELGDDLASIVLDATTVKKTNDITAVKFLRDGVEINNVLVPDADGGAESYTETDPIVVTTSFTATVGDGTQTTTSNAITITFVYPFYYGVGAQGLSATQIQALTKSVKSKSDTSATTSPSNEVYYIAYPASYGDLTSILDTNGFETIGDYTKSVVAFTMLDGNVINYNVYEFNNLTTQTNFTNTYIF